ncbi:MAG: hypothetical protein HN344_06375, partial [Gammaproteobacteria bacterium]|nr:hypothetical protein [Gammaproteobacteria bacterium]
MGRLRFENAASWKLAAQITADATEITLETPEGLPVLAEGDYFYLTMEEGQNVEVVRVNGIVGETLTVVRGQDNTSASPFNAYVTIEMRVNAAILRDVIDERQALEQRCIESDAQLQANIDAQSANVGGATSQIVSSAIRTLLADETQVIDAGASKIFTHTSDPVLLRSVFIEKKIHGGVNSVTVDATISDEPIVTVGETTVSRTVSVANAESVAQTAIDGKAATTALSFDGGSTWSEFAEDHGTLMVPEGAAALSVKALLVESPPAMPRGAVSALGDDGVLGAWPTAWHGLCSATLVDGMHFDLEILKGAQGWIGVADGPLVGYRGVCSADAGSWQTIFDVTGSAAMITADVVGSSVVFRNNGSVVATLDIGNYADPCVFAMSEIAGVFKIIETPSYFGGITFDRTDRSSWLIDNEAEWAATLLSATTTSVQNISGVSKEARVRIGATGVVRYMYDRVIPAGAEEILQLPITHNNAAAV